MPFTFAILGAILAYTWVLKPRLPDAVVGVPVVIVLLLGLWHDLRTREWGLDAHALIEAARASALFTLAAVAALLGIGALLGSIHTRTGTLGNLAALVAWGVAQQWLLQTVFLRESQRATSRRAGRVLAAVLFATLHLPNPFLAAVTLVGALGWCAIYDRHPHVLPLGLSHAIATLTVLYAFDDTITGGLRIGLSYLTR